MAQRNKSQSDQLQKSVSTLIMSEGDDEGKNKNKLNAENESEESHSDSEGFESLQTDVSESISAHTVSFEKQMDKVQAVEKKLRISDSVGSKMDKKLSKVPKIASSTTFGEDHFSFMSDVTLETHSRRYSIFTVFEKNVIVAVLCEVVKQIKVFQTCLPFPNFDWKRVIVSTEDYLNRIMSQVQEKMFSDYNEYDKSDFWKMQIDLYEIHGVLHDTTKEIFAESKYTALFNSIDESRYLQYQESIVAQEHKYLKKLLVAFKKKYFRKEVEYNTVDNEEREFNTKEEEKFDTRVWMQIECRYQDAWEKERQIQNAMKIEKEENALIDVLRTTASNQRCDIRVSNEIESYLNGEIMMLETALKEWTNLYNNDIESRDTELTAMISEKESIDNQMKTMLISFNEREEKVQEIRDFFIEKEKEEELKFLLNKGATILQRWWRKFAKMRRNFINQQKLLKKLLKQQKAEKAKLKKAKKV